mmetsp:Transcript_20258/g.51168  ORF Transcript_20258/g.51168 Transcript_20258/m.51168 type:complete len:303 (-) Transcript_20258:261-1169(-)
MGHLRLCRSRCGCRDVVGIRDLEAASFPGSIHDDAEKSACGNKHALPYLLVRNEAHARLPNQGVLNVICRHRLHLCVALLRVRCSGRYPPRSEKAFLSALAAPGSSRRIHPDVYQVHPDPHQWRCGHRRVLLQHGHRFPRLIHRQVPVVHPPRPRQILEQPLGERTDRFLLFSQHLRPPLLRALLFAATHDRYRAQRRKREGQANRLRVEVDANGGRMPVRMRYRGQSEELVRGRRRFLLHLGLDQLVGVVEQVLLRRQTLDHGHSVVGGDLSARKRVVSLHGQVQLSCRCVRGHVDTVVRE